MAQGRGNSRQVRFWALLGTIYANEVPVDPAHSFASTSALPSRLPIYSAEPYRIARAGWWQPASKPGSSTTTNKTSAGHWNWLPDLKQEQKHDR
jgi:hypothetical protein